MNNNRTPIKMPDNKSDAPATSIDECFKTSFVKKRTPNANPKAETMASISPKVMIVSDEVAQIVMGYLQLL